MLKILTLFLSQRLLDEHPRWVLWWPVSLGSGILLYFSATNEPSLLSTSLFLLIGTGGLIILKKWDIGRFFGPLIFFFFLGIACATWRTAYLSTRMLTEKQTLSFRARLDRCEIMPEKTRLILRPQDQPHLPQLVRLTLPKHERQKIFLPGTEIHLTAHLLPLAEPATPHGYNFRRAAYFQGIGAVGRIEALQVRASPPLYWHETLEPIRQHLTTYFRTHLGKELGAIAAALITGDRAGISPTTQQHFADAGIAHILAISGLHLSLVTGLLFLMVRRSLVIIPGLAERFPLKKWAAALALIASAGYLALSGFGVPAKRAFVMTALVLLGVLLDRQALSMRSLALAALGILILWPELLLSASLQLSFAAVIALITLYEFYVTHPPFITPPRRLMGYIIGIIGTTVVATLATTPFIIVLFNRFTLQAILGNLLGIPLIAFIIMPLGILSLMSLSVGGIPLIFKAWGYSLDWLIAIAHTISALPGSAILMATPSPWFLIFIVAGELWFCFWQGPWRRWGIFLMGIGCFFLFHSQTPDVFLSGEGRVIGIRQGDTLWVTPSSRSSYYAGLWMREMGIHHQLPLSDSCLHRDGGIIVSQKGKRFPYKDFVKCCQNVSFILSNGPVPPPCRTPGRVIIDGRQLRQKGTHAIWIHQGQLTILTLSDMRGNRPWNFLNKSSLNIN